MKNRQGDKLVLQLASYRNYFNVENVMLFHSHIRVCNWFSSLYGCDCLEGLQPRCPFLLQADMYCLIEYVSRKTVRIYSFIVCNTNSFAAPNCLCILSKPREENLNLYVPSHCIRTFKGFAVDALYLLLNYALVNL